MKVNTDGVLLGAWAKVGNTKRILDIGTGTGVIALMMAQQHVNTFIEAIDIDSGSAVQAKENFELSDWKDRLQVFHTALQDFKPNYAFDFIISNPPYFVDDLKPIDSKKNVAKHSVSLSYEELLHNVKRLLSPTGKFALVIPYFNKALVLNRAEKVGLYASNLMVVKAREDKPPYLLLLLLEQHFEPQSEIELSIQTITGEFTGAYKTLTKDFYLKF